MEVTEAMREEAVARALVPALCGSQEDEHGNDLPDKQFDDLPPDWQARHLEYARAAITAMRALEPRASSDGGEVVVELQELAAWLERSGGAASWLSAVRKAIHALQSQPSSNEARLREALDIVGIRQLEDDVQHYSGNEASGRNEVLRRKAVAWDATIAVLSNEGNG